MNTQSENIAELAIALSKAQAENLFFYLTMIERMDSISRWKKNTTSIIMFLKKLVRFTMSGKGLEKDTFHLSVVVNYGMRSTRNMAAML